MVDKVSGVERIIANKEHFREQCIRNGYCLPESEAFCTIDYMFGVVKGRLYCPKYSEVRLAPCPTPPPKEDVLSEVIRILAVKKKFLGDTRKQAPERKWLLLVLSTLAPGHLFFTKAYQPPPRPSKHRNAIQPDLPADFFIG